MRSKVKADRQTDRQKRLTAAPGPQTRSVILVTTDRHSADPDPYNVPQKTRDPHGKSYSLSLLVISSTGCRTVATVFYCAASISLSMSISQCHCHEGQVVNGVRIWQFRVITILLSHRIH